MTEQDKLRKYKHSNLPWIDWRDESRRKELFMRWLQWRVKYADLDLYPLNNAFRDATGDRSPTGLPMTKEQQYWGALLFGMTYMPEMTWIAYWNFPDFWEIDPEKLQKWNADNVHRQRYANDTKYNKGRIAVMVEDITKKVKPYGTLENFFTRLVDEDEHASCLRILEEVQKFYKYGRMTSWLTAQYLWETCGLPIRPKTLLATDPSSWSIRSGIGFLVNDPEFLGQGHMSPGVLKRVAAAEEQLIEEAKDWILPEGRAIWSNFLLESQCCQYKKLIVGGDYVGHSTGDHYGKVRKLEVTWPEVNFAEYHEKVVPQFHPMLRKGYECRALRYLCSETGQLINAHEDWSEVPDMWKEIDCDLSDLESEKGLAKITKSVGNYVKEYKENVTPDTDVLSIFRS